MTPNEVFEGVDMTPIIEAFQRLADAIRAAAQRARTVLLEWGRKLGFIARDAMSSIVGILLSHRSRRYVGRFGIRAERARAQTRRRDEWSAFALRAGLAP